MRGLVETSQGMKYMTGDESGKKAKKKGGGKKKAPEKSVTVCYNGEKMHLSMGADAKDSQVTEFEAELFAHPEKVENVDGMVLELAKSFSGSK